MNARFCSSKWETIVVEKAMHITVLMTSFHGVVML